MPVWHDATKRMQDEGRILMVGIIEEQHPERCRLFMQWKGMDWPVLVDSQDLLGVSAVPITLLIDEHGIIRERVRGRGDPAEIVERFLATEYEAPAKLPPPPRPPDVDALTARAAAGGTASDLRAHGEALLLWGGEGAQGRAIEAFTRALALEPDDGGTHFRLGVAYRMRYDSPGGTPADFAAAAEQWGLALAADPNQYIWRRRIEQYGPRLDKPYPFYDWVAEARTAVEARGESPVALPVEPAGAELTAPSRSFDAAPATADEAPDPGGRILRDPGKLIAVEVTTVPHRIEPGAAARVHLEFRPRRSADAHWNNEATGLVVWIDPPAGWSVDRRRVELPLPPRPVSDEPRRVEFEVRRGADAGPLTLTGRALYYVCEGVTGQCLYRRQDLELVPGAAEPRVAESPPDSPQ